MSQRVVINKCFGGFGLSHEAFLRLRELGQKDALEEPDYGEFWSDNSGPRREQGFDTFCRDIPRDDPLLLQVVKELGSAAGGRFAALEVVDIPDGVEWAVEEYDGSEWVAEKHRTWA